MLQILLCYNITILQILQYYNITNTTINICYYNELINNYNIRQYKTMRAKELQSILEQRKKKADSIFGDNVFKSNDRQQTSSQLFSASVTPLGKVISV